MLSQVITPEGLIQMAEEAGTEISHEAAIAAMRKIISGEVKATRFGDGLLPSALEVAKDIQRNNGNGGH
jgi:hypothetical protein